MLSRSGTAGVYFFVLVLKLKMFKTLVKTAIGCNELGRGIKSDLVGLTREEASQLKISIHLLAYE